MLTVLALIIVLGVLIFVHEAGHFVAAKWAGIYVHRFSLGLGSPIPWLTFKRGETEYSISWLPLGGYVKMASREEDIGSSALEGGAAAAAPVPRDRMFEAKPIWKRMVVILAGVTMNGLFAWGVFAFLAYKNGRQIDPVTTVGRVIEDLVPPGGEALRQIEPGTRIESIDDKPITSWDEVQQGIANASDEEVRIGLSDGKTVTLSIHPDALEARLKASQALQPFRAPVVGQVIPGRPAARAGIQAGDTIVALDGKPLAQWYDLLETLQASAGKTLELELARGERRRVEVSPETESVRGPDGKMREVGRIGVAVGASFRSEPLGIGAAIVEGGRATIGASTQIIRTVRGLFTGRISQREVGGPILIGQLAGESAKAGLDPFLAFMALISINLAILNLLPVPVLDGGQFLFLLAEAVIRRPLPLKLRERLTMVGLVLIVLLMGLAFSNDIRRLVGG